MTRDEMKQYKQRAANMSRAGHQIEKLTRSFMVRFKCSREEAQQMVRDEHEGLWASYQLGTPLPSGQRTTIYKI